MLRWASAGARSEPPTLKHSTKQEQQARHQEQKSAQIRRRKRRRAGQRRQRGARHCSQQHGQTTWLCAGPARERVWGDTAQPLFPCTKGMAARGGLGTGLLGQGDSRGVRGQLHDALSGPGSTANHGARLQRGAEMGARSCCAGLGLHRVPIPSHGTQSTARHPGSGLQPVRSGGLCCINTMHNCRQRGHGGDNTPGLRRGI